MYSLGVGRYAAVGRGFRGGWPARCNTYRVEYFKVVSCCTRRSQTLLHNLPPVPSPIGGLHAWMWSLQVRGVSEATLNLDRGRRFVTCIQPEGSQRIDLDGSPVQISQISLCLLIWISPGTSMVRFANARHNIMHPDLRPQVPTWNVFWASSKTICTKKSVVALPPAWNATDASPN